MGNEALNNNPPDGVNIHLTEHGSDWYWAAFALFALFSLLHLAGAYKFRPISERIFFFNSVASLFFISVTYFTLASNLGWTPVRAEFHHQDGNSSESIRIRQIFYARYIGWFLSFPPVIANLAILTAVPWSTALFTILVQEVFVVDLLIGSLIPSTYKWGYFVFAVVALLLVGFNLVFSYRKEAHRLLDTASFTGYQFSAGLLFFLLVLYPICWGLSEGGNVISNDSEGVFYGILDVLVFVVINTVFQFYIRKLDFSQIGLSTNRDALFHEKNTSFEENHNGVSSSPPVVTTGSEQAAPVAAPAAEPATTQPPTV